MLFCCIEKLVPELESFCPMSGEPPDLVGESKKKKKKKQGRAAIGLMAENFLLRHKPYLKICKTIIRLFCTSGFISLLVMVLKAIESVTKVALKLIIQS